MVKTNQEGKIMHDFIVDLDAFFCEKYAGYDKISILPGYKMPVMQASKVDEFGRTRTYTLPANTMRLAAQEKKTELLAELKNRMVDTTFTFSFAPQGFFARLKARFSKYAFYKNLERMMRKYDFTDAEAAEALSIENEIWRGIRKGAFLPSKNLIFSIALAAHMSFDDTQALLALAGFEWDFAVVKDVILCYLLQQKVYNAPMIERALTEYKIGNLFLK